MVIGAPPPLAPRLELTARAERDGQRVDIDPGRDRRDEPLSHAVVVGEEVRNTQTLALAGPEYDVHPLRKPPLDAPDLLRIEAELQHVGRLRVPGELRVDHLVTAVGLSFDEVGEAAPRAVHEAGLIDHFRA